MTCLGLGAHGLFGNQQAIFPNLPRQLRVFSRVNNINPTTQYRNCAYADCRGMRRGIDAAGKARTNHIPSSPNVVAKNRDIRVPRDEALRAPTKAKDREV